MKQCYEKYFDKLTEDGTYILGMLTADGHVHKTRIALALKDKDIVYNIRTELGADSKRKLAWSKKAMYSFSITNEYLVNSLASYNIIPNKTFNMKHPDNIDDSYYNHYLRGLIDGDGSFNIYARSLVVQLLGTKNLLDGVISTVNKLTGISGHLYKSKNEQIYRAKWYKGSRDLLDYIYKGSNLKMTRKYNNYLRICDTLESAGSHLGRLTRHSLDKERIIDKYKSKIYKFYVSKERIPTYNEFRKLGSLSTVYKYFGSFNKMISECGYHTREAIKVKI